MRDGEDDARGPAPPGAAREAAAKALFDGGPPRLLVGSHLLGPPGLNVGLQCIVFVLLTWVPAGLFALRDGQFWRTPDGISFLADVGVHARYLATGPLLIAGAAIVADVLSRIVRQLAAGAIVPAHELARYEQVLRSTRAMRDALLAEVAVVGIAYGISFFALGAKPASALPMWHRLAPDSEQLSAAGWWFALVSLPLLLTLLLGWVWRLALWTRFLYGLARLDLELVPAHPDRAAGIGFITF